MSSIDCIILAVEAVGTIVIAWRVLRP